MLNITVSGINGESTSTTYMKINPSFEQMLELIEEYKEANPEACCTIQNLKSGDMIAETSIKHDNNEVLVDSKLISWQEYVDREYVDLGLF